MVKVSSQNHQVLIMTGDYIGTLAAIRSFGEKGIRVTLADPEISTSCYSKFLHAYVKCPPIKREKDLLEWLLDYGSSNPMTLLYPSCDNTVWFISNHKTSLERVFTLFFSDKEVIYSLLNKRKLAHLCDELEIDHPKSYFPQPEEDIASYSEKVGFPFF